MKNLLDIQLISDSLFIFLLFQLENIVYKSDFVYYSLKLVKPMSAVFNP